MDASPISPPVSTSEYESPMYVWIIRPESPGQATDVNRHVWPCKAGQRIARVGPLPEGAGDSSGPPPVTADGITLGRHVAWTEDRLAILAERTGHVVLRHTTLSVEETLDFVDDLDSHAGKIDFHGPVLVRKSIRDGVTLSAAGEITVHGSIEAATVHAAGDITVHHGICGKEQGRVSAAGSVRARFASNARITAGADVQIQNEVSNSKIDCGGAFLGANATLLSGEITARRGITCDAAGTETGVPVVLDLGLPPAELRKLGEAAEQLKSLQQASRNIREKVEPLMQNPKRLTKEQKEKATELLFSAAEAEERASGLLRSLEASGEQIEVTRKAAIVVRTVLHPGVTLRIGGMEALVRKLVRGPLKAIREDAPGEPGIALIDGHSRRLATLPAAPAEGYKVLQEVRAAEGK